MAEALFSSSVQTDLAEAWLFIDGSACVKPYTIR